MKNKVKFTRGYKECREKLRNNPKYLMSCFNCVHYYKAYGDAEEMCQNNDVVEYDMIVDASQNRVYCLKWQPMSTKGEIFHKTGRGVLD